MKTWTKRILYFLLTTVITIALFSFSCTKDSSSANTSVGSIIGNGNTVFADSSPAVQIPSESLAVVEALQSAFRSVSSSVLPSVVEIDVIETKTRQVNSLDGFPFRFFFDQGNSDDGENKTEEYKQSGLGSGVIVRKHKNTFYVLTNNHVAGEASEITVKMFDGREFSAKLIGHDDRKDIALVSFESDDSSIPVAKLGDSEKVQIGDICFAMGTPLGYSSSVTQGIVSATGRNGSNIGNISDFIQTDAAINQGNSGGPLINIYGEVIGINTWIASQSGGSQGLGFSIPINNIKKAIDAFIKDGKVTYGWMGVSLVEITKEYQKELGVEGKSGAFASQIFLGSPAAKGGLQAGDYVISLNGKKVKDTSQLVRDVGDLSIGEKAEFIVIRGGKEVTVIATIENRSDTVVTDNSKLWPGFIAYPLTDELKDKINPEDKNVQGIVVTNVQAKSPAAALRLQQGDIITAVNDKSVKNLSEFYSALITEGQKEIWFDVYSEGSKITTGKYKF